MLLLHFGIAPDELFAYRIYILSMMDDLFSLISSREMASANDTLGLLVWQKVVESRKKRRRRWVVSNKRGKCINVDTHDNTLSGPLYLSSTYLKHHVG